MCIPSPFAVEHRRSVANLPKWGDSLGFVRQMPAMTGIWTPRSTWRYAKAMISDPCAVCQLSGSTWFPVLAGVDIPRCRQEAVFMLVPLG